MVMVRRGFTCVPRVHRACAVAWLAVLAGTVGSACDGASSSAKPAGHLPQGGQGESGGSPGGAGSSGGSGAPHVSLPEIPKTCGDSKADPEEACDDGNREDGDGCDRYCQVEPEAHCPPAGVCNLGDGKVGWGEDCDDGNVAVGDGCTAEGKLEDGWVCAVPGRACRPLCGDGKLVAPETCDDGNTLSGDGCGPDCRVEQPCAGGAAGESGDGGETSGCAPEGPYCGDGRVDPDEVCDDGVNDAAYVWDAAGVGCAPGCIVSHYCGDGIVDGAYGESCDTGSHKTPACLNCHIQGGP